MEEKKAHILLVDDEPDLVQMVSVRLRAAGHTVSTAYDGQQALDSVKREIPDLMILDLMLPKLDGYKVCRLLKFDEKTRNLPILIFTARAQVDDITLATECGADAYLTKPFEAKALLGKIQELLAEYSAKKGKI